MNDFLNKGILFLINCVYNNVYGGFDMINKLIVNGDDFGMSLGTTLGILIAHQQGILTSTTCMMNMPYAQYALDEAKKHPHLGVGVHLVLTVGKPLIEGKKSYTDQDGNFIRPKDYPDGHPHADSEELYLEWKAQIEKFIEITGHKPTHIDSHHHVHLLPWHIEVAKTLAQEYDIPMRQRDRVLDTYESVRCFDQMYHDDVNYDFFTNVLKNNTGNLEFMCHPALIDQRLYDMTSYHLPRMKELELLTSDEVKTFLQEHHIESIHFSMLEKTKS